MASGTCPYDDLWMKVQYGNERLLLRGINTPAQLIQMTLGHLKRATQLKSVLMMFHLLFHKGDNETRGENRKLPCIPNMLEPEHQTILEALLEEYKTVFREPKGLPPNQSHDHQIPLLPESRPVSVRPY